MSAEDAEPREFLTDEEAKEICREVERREEEEKRELTRQQQLESHLQDIINILANMHKKNNV